MLDKFGNMTPGCNPVCYQEILNLLAHLIDAQTLLGDMYLTTGVTPDLGHALRSSVIKASRLKHFPDIPLNQGLPKSVYTRPT